MRSPACSPSLLPAPAYTVDGGERAILYDRFRGVLDKPVGEGTHIKIPWVQSPNVMDIRIRPRSISSVTGTKGERRGSVTRPAGERESSLGTACKGVERERARACTGRWGAAGPARHSRKADDSTPRATAPIFIQTCRW